MGNFATTIARFKVSYANINAPMTDTVQMKNGKILRSWEFFIGSTKPFNNTVAPK